MDSTVSNELLKRLDLLAAKLGSTGEHLWSVLVKQARVEAWTDLGIAATWIAVSVAAAFVMRAVVRKDDDFEGAAFAIVFLCGVTIIIGAIAAATYLWSVPTELINPEYWALKQILTAVK